MRRTWPVGRYVSGSKVGGEGRAGDTNLGVMSKQENSEIQSRKNTWKDKSSFFGLKNADVANNLKQFIPDHLNFLGDEEDNVVCWEQVEPKY